MKNKMTMHIQKEVEVILYKGVHQRFENSLSRKRFRGCQEIRQGIAATTSR
jgi:hypothetical protein